MSQQRYSLPDPQRGEPDDRFGSLSTDYLNRFVEVVCLLDLAIEEPQVLSAVLPWEEVDYVTYFQRSSVRAAGSAIALFHALSPSCRERLAEVTGELNRLTQAALSAMVLAPDSAERRRIHAAVKPPLMAQIELAQGFANNRDKLGFRASASTETADMA